MKVDATENSPSRRRCMAMARLTSWGCDERASLEAGGIGLSLNFCRSREYVWSQHHRFFETHLVQGLAVLVQAGIYGLDVFLGGLEALLDRVVELSQCQRRGLRICTVTIRLRSAGRRTEFLPAAIRSRAAVNRSMAFCTSAMLPERFAVCSSTASCSRSSCMPLGGGAMARGQFSRCGCCGDVYVASESVQVVNGKPRSPVGP